MQIITECWIIVNETGYHNVHNIISTHSPYDRLNAEVGSKMI